MSARDVLVLGASGTIGGAVVKELRKGGANVHTPGRDFTWNPANPWGLVCCFGSYGPKGKLADVKANEMYQCLFLNVFTVMVQVREFIKLLDGRPGRIVLMSGGGVGSDSMPEERTSYVAAKHAIVGFVDAMSRELGGRVLINAVAPGPVKSRMTADDERTDWVEPTLAASLVADLVMDEHTVSGLTGKLWSARTRRCFNLRSND